MSNQPNYRRAPSLAEFAEKRLAEGSISIEMPDGGDPIIIPPPEFWSAETREVQRGVRRGKSTASDVAKAVLGEDFERFSLAVAATVPGMDPGEFFVLYYHDATSDKQGETPGK